MAMRAEDVRTPTFTDLCDRSGQKPLPVDAHPRISRISTTDSTRVTSSDLILIDYFSAFDGAGDPVENHVRTCVVQDEIVPEKAILDPIGERRKHREDLSRHR